MNVATPAENPVPFDPHEAKQRLISVLALRRDPSLAPGGGAFGALVERFIPLVYGMAQRLFPESPASVLRVTAATFECFTAHWRRLPKRTLVGPWLMRAAVSVGYRELKRLGKAAKNTPAAEYFLLFKRISQLNKKWADAFLVSYALDVAPAIAAEALGTKPFRVQLRARKAASRLGRKLRKTSLGADVPGALRALWGPAPPEAQAEIVGALRRWAPAAPKADLTRATLVAWRWLAIRTFFKRVLAGVGAVVVLLLSLGFTVHILAQRGYLTEFFIRQGSRQMAREHPEMLKPARPWPVTAEDRSRATHGAPETAAGLYRITNIWTARFSFTAEQWEAMQAERVPPVRQLFQNGRIILRNPNARRSGLAGSLGFDFPWAEAQFEFAGVSFDRVGVRYRGNGTYVQSLYGPKQSLKVDLNKFTKRQKLAGVDEFNFVNAVPDFSYVRDALAQQLFRDLGVPAPRTAYAYLSITVPEKWDDQALGLYCMIENLDKDFAKDRFGTKKVPIFKPVTYDLFLDIGSEWNDYAVIYDLKTDATPEQLQRVIDFAKLVSSATDEEFAAHLAEFLDVEEFAAFVAGHSLLSSYDGFFTNGQNFYVYLDPRSNRFGFISWDQDHSWGEFGYTGTAEEREQASIWEPALYDFKFLKRTMKTPVFREAYKRKLEEALEKYFTRERLYAQVDQLAAAIRPAVAAESDFRLKRFDQSVSNEWLPGPREGQAEGPNAPVHQIKRFIENRIASVRDQLEGRSEGSKLTRRF
jgi:hypothetical protein